MQLDVGCRKLHCGYLRGLTADAAALRDRERMESRKAHDENPIGARMVKGVEPEMHPNSAPVSLRG